MRLEDLYGERRWVCYGTDKIPVDPISGRYASTTNPSTWGTHDQATATMLRRGLAGVGIVLTGDGIVGIDLDDCIKPKEGAEGTEYTAEPYARYLLGLAPSYAELSPSGTGIHILGLATIPKAIKTHLNGIGVEVYDRARYLTVTEQPVAGHDIAMVNIQHIVDAVADEIDELAKPKPTVHTDAPVGTTDRWIETIVQRRIDAAVEMVTAAPDGTRHNTRLRAARLIGGYLEAAQREGVTVVTDDEAIRILMEARPPSQGSQRSERRAIEAGIAYGRSAPVELPKPTAPIPKTKRTTTNTETVDEVAAVKESLTTDEDDVHLTDLGNGKRLVTACGDRLCYVSEWKQWLVWDGTRWARGDDAGVVKLAHAVVLGIYKTLADLPTLESREKAFKWAQASESAMRIDAMIKSARPYLTRRPGEFDTHPHLLNTANCTVDLRTMQTHPHTPADMLTRIVPVPYLDVSMSPRWATFLRTIFQGDDELIDYVQRAVGYTLTGQTDEHCLFFCYGDGANGKSTFMRALELISGEYSAVASVEALLEKRGDGDGATPTIAGLVGKRLATAQEMPDGKRFDESLIKSITGGDAITARVLYGSPFTFRPSHTLWITGNHKPRIVSTDVGIWRRIRIVPFTASIPADARRDSREFDAQFLEDASAILQWAVLGAYLWYQSGVGSCAAVDAATREYRGEEDLVARFVHTVCTVGPDTSVRKDRLYAAWKEWAEDEGERSASYKSQRWLVQQLLARKIAGRRDKHSVYGVGLVDDAHQDDESPRYTRGQMRRAEV
jgi:putative DNA primase/helicase